MSRAGKIEEQARVAKERKQKKLLIGLAPLLLLLLVWQGPGILKTVTGGGGTATTAAGPTTLTSTVAATPDPTGAAPTTAGTPAVVETPSGVPATLPETDETASAGEGQLVRFDRFLGKDPFRQLVKANEPVAPPADDGSGGTITPVPPDNEPPGSGEPSAFTSAALNVNGVEEELSKGATFPQSDPLFRLVSISAKSVKIGLVSGSFSNGKETITVKLGKTVTLVSQPDGIRYVIKLVSVGSTS
jgi:hypothetical protein